MMMRWCCVFVALAVAAVGARAEEPSREQVAADVIEYMQGLAEEGFGGGVLIARDGEVLFEGGFGWANREKRIRWTPETVYTVGSITKQFTAHAILKLEEDGKLSVKDPIAKWFDDVPEDKQPITIHHLLTHTSRIRDSFGGDFTPTATRDWIVDKALNSDLLRGPGIGERYTYSNAGYSLLGVIVEKASGMGYEEYMWTTFFEPLGMLETGYTIPNWDPDRFAHGYVNGEDWGVVAEKHALPDGPNWNLCANGGIHSTLRDMHTWYKARREGRVLTPENIARMETPMVPEDPRGRSHYGYGFAHAITARGTTFVGHNGGNGIFFADFRMYPDEDTLILIATNTAAGFPDEGYVRAAIDTVFPPEESESNVEP